MRPAWKDAEHLVRMAAVFAAGIAIFVVLRAVLVPPDFGRYGHFRPGALADNRDRALAFASQAACEDCHADIVGLRVGSKHATVACEACHGPLARHADDPENVKPIKPDAKSVCLVCHQDNVAKPKRFPQVDVREHGDGQACNTCHKPHHPEIS